MKLRRVLLLGMFLTTGLVQAQTDFRSGFIVKASGDTLDGEIDYRGDLLMSTVCRFKDVENTIKEYRPHDISAFRFIDGKYYVSKEIDRKNVFLEYLIQGKINIYYMRDEFGDHYYLDKEDVNLTEIPYEEGNKYLDGRRVSFETTKHIGLLIYSMKDAPELQSRIASVKKPEHKNLIKLAEDYHNAVCEGEKCIIYAKETPFLKANLGVVAGVIRFDGFEDVKDRFYSQSGLIAHFSMPRTNENIYFMTGLSYFQAEDIEGEVYRFIDIPTHIGYVAPNSYRIRPSVSIGLLTPAYSAGVAVRIGKTINMGFQSRVNFTFDKVPWIPSGLLSYSMLGSLYFEL